MPDASGDAPVPNFVLNAVPKYLLTLWEYIIKRPRRFFLQYEQEPERYLDPWLFLILNALAAAGLALLVTSSGTSAQQWDWNAFWTIVPAGFMSHFLVVACGGLAALLTRQSVTPRAMLTAFSYASTWVLLYVPAFAWTGESYIKGHPSWPLPALLLCSIEIVHIGYLVVSFARLNYIEGRHAVYFMATTIALTLAISAATMLGLAKLTDQDRAGSLAQPPQTAIDHYFVPLCNHATLNARVETQESDTLAWFEWGKTPNLGTTTVKRRFTSDADMHQPLGNLREQTTYFYRVVMSNKHGTRRGLLLSFTTARCEDATTYTTNP